MTSPEIVLNEVASRRNGLVYYTNRIEAAARAGALTDSDVRRSYRGAFLEFFSTLENGMEKLFVGIVMERYAYPGGRVRSLVRIRSNRVARKVVFGGRSYADWLPYHHTRRRAKAFLSTGSPFTDVPKGDQKLLDSLSDLRNALAHESGYSLRVFREEFVEGNALPTSQQSPTGYLRGQYAAGSSRFDYLTARGVRILRDLCDG